MITIPNRSSVAKAHEQFDEAGRLRSSPYYDRLVDVMEELMKFTYFYMRNVRLFHEPPCRAQGRRRKIFRASGIEGRTIAARS
jgi:hypothetical protein